MQKACVKAKEVIALQLHLDQLSMYADELGTDQMSV